MREEGTRGSFFVGGWEGAEGKKTRGNIENWSKSREETLFVISPLFDLKGERKKKRVRKRE